MPLNRRQFERRNSLGHGADQLHAVGLQEERRGRHDSSDDEEQRDRFVFEENFSNNKQPQRDSSNQKRYRVCLVQMFEEEASVLPKTSVRAVKSEKLRQLRAGEKKRDAAFESGHDTFGYEMHEHSSSGDPCDESDERDGQRACAGEHAEAPRIADDSLPQRRSGDLVN